METIQLLLQGFSVALEPANLLVCAIGVIVGTLVGALPGIGPTGAIAMLLAATYKLGAESAIIMLAGIYYGTQYGGTVTSVLMGVPGESSSVVTTLDGYQLAKQGKAGKALGIAAVGSFIGGTISVIGLMLVGPNLAQLALIFGPAEYFALMMLAFSLVTAFTGKSMVRGFIALCLGLLLSMVGQDVMTGVPRFTFDNVTLLDGIDFLPIGVGLFGLAEAIESFESGQRRSFVKADLSWRKVLPCWQDIRETFMPMLRGTFLGFLAGTLPGVGATMASFLSYGVEQRVSKTPEKFGKGALAGVAGPETANNAVTGAAFIPMLSLGIPAGASSALLLGALLMFGLQPGPTLFQDAPAVVWGLIASMYIGNLMLVIINMAFIPGIVKVMEKIQPYLATVVLLLAVLGVYSFRSSTTDIVIMLLAGLVGYGMKKVQIPSAPVILGLLLGGMAEISLRQALTISKGSLLIFVEKPVAAGFLVVAILSIALAALTVKGKGKALRSEDVEG
ncbi:tripartite tricarboxylate transporter permease [Sporomusa sp.]|uniref:tripartite tricarboxylate transporter permease n=1 Tax=Sporomusa sp. TaxID=2078658 RepID=UPI002B59A9CC|nr:tripartite tricarboxylate transporter permease [Sporomusa sp.]HWR10049.1 tripartite tricarboxylate transporter permease [Sporomusa sp.]